MPLEYRMFEGTENGGLLWNDDFCLTYQQKPKGKRDTVSAEQVVLLHIFLWFKAEVCHLCASSAKVF